MSISINIEKLKKTHKEWVSKDGESHRVYIRNDIICHYLGFEYLKRRTGSIDWAKIDGEQISAQHALNLLAHIDTLKLYYDLNKNEFIYNYSDFKYLTIDQVKSIINLVIEDANYIYLPEK